MCNLPTSNTARNYERGQPSSAHQLRVKAETEFRLFLKQQRLPATLSIKADGRTHPFDSGYYCFKATAFGYDGLIAGFGDRDMRWNFLLVEDTRRNPDGFETWKSEVQPNSRQETLAQVFRSTPSKHTRMKKAAEVAWLKSGLADHRVDDVLYPVDVCAPGRRCRKNYCCSCGPRLKNKEVLKSSKKIIASVGGLPNRENVSAVTILGPRVVLGDKAIGSVARAMRTHLHIIGRHKLGTTKWVGHFHISPWSRRLHLHAIVEHRGLSRDKLEEVLRKEFKLPKKAVWVKELYTHQSVRKAIVQVLRYSSEARPYVPDQKKHLPLPKDFTERSSLCLLSYYYLCAGTYEGLRFSMNTKSLLRWKGALLVDPTTGEVIAEPNLEELIFRRRCPSLPTSEFGRILEARRTAKRLDARRGIFLTPARPYRATPANKLTPVPR